MGWFIYFVGSAAWMGQECLLAVGPLSATWIQVFALGILGGQGSTPCIPRYSEESEAPLGTPRHPKETLGTLGIDRIALESLGIPRNP